MAMICPAGCRASYDTITLISTLCVTGEDVNYDFLYDGTYVKCACYIICCLQTQHQDTHLPHISTLNRRHVKMARSLLLAYSCKAVQQYTNIAIQMYSGTAVQQ